MRTVLKTDTESGASKRTISTRRLDVHVVTVIKQM